MYFVNFFGVMLREFTRQHEPLVLFASSVILI